MKDTNFKMKKENDLKMINFTTITACGECCTGCSKKNNGVCGGCIEADGYVPEWAGSGRCKIHECAGKHNVQFCGICSEFPCDKLPSIIHWNPNIIEHLYKLAEQYHKQIDGIKKQNEGKYGNTCNDN